jgi:hypothetical protein
MDQNKQLLLEALKRNLFLKESLREEIVRKLPNLTETQNLKILALLQQANANQDKTLKSILEREPYFFHRIEQTILHTMSEEFNRLTLVEIEQAEANLLEDIKNYKD